MLFAFRHAAFEICLSTQQLLKEIGQGAGFQIQGSPCSKTLGGSNVNLAFYPSEVGKMSTRNFWELTGKN